MKSVIAASILIGVGWAMGGAAIAADAVESARAGVAGRKFEGVWYRTEERGKMAVFLASGDLTISTDVLSFDSKKRPFTIPTNSIRRLRWARFDDDPITTWMVVDYVEQGGVRIAAFRDAALGRDTDSIFTSIQAVVPLPSPANAVAGQPDFVMPGDPGTFSTYRGHARQFTIDVPSGWFVRDQSDVAGSPGTRGVIAFSAESFAAGGRSVEEVEQALKRHDTGEAPTFFVDRHFSGSGMSCEAYTKSAEAAVLTGLQSPATLGKDATVSEPARVAVVRVGECFGLKIRIDARESDGRPLNMLVYTVSDGTTRFDFALRNHAGFFERNLPTFEKSIKTVKLTSKNGPKAGH